MATQEEFEAMNQAPQATRTGEGSVDEHTISERIKGEQFGPHKNPNIYKPAFGLTSAQIRYGGTV